MDVTRILQRGGSVRLQLERALELRQRLFVLPITMIIELAERDVHLGEIWRESDGLLGHAPELCQVRFTHLLDEPMTLDAALDQTRHGEREVWIARNGLPVPGSRLVERLRLQGTIGQAFLVLAFQKEVVSSRVLCWSSRERAGFRR